MGNHNWKKIGGLAAITLAIGVYPGKEGVGAVYRAVDAYRAAANQTLAAPQIDFRVPADGSVNFGEQVDAEVKDGFFARRAYRRIVENEMIQSLGPGWTLDDVENVLWRPDKETVWDPHTQSYEEVPGHISMKGGMPNGRTVPVRDYNGDGRFGNQPSKRQIKGMQRSDFMNAMSRNSGRR